MESLRKVNHDVSWDLKKEQHRESLHLLVEKSYITKLTGHLPPLPSMEIKKKVRQSKILVHLWLKKSKCSESMMALSSHCHVGLYVKLSVMSPTLQLCTFIKRLQTPPLTHWQDWVWLIHLASPFVHWCFVQIKAVSKPYQYVFHKIVFRRATKHFKHFCTRFRAHIYIYICVSIH